MLDQQIVMFGAGSAGTSVADGLRAAMKGEGLTEENPHSRFWVINKDGLLHSGWTPATRRSFRQRRRRKRQRCVEFRNYRQRFS
jgi:malic enzyme